MRVSSSGVCVWHDLSLYPLLPARKVKHQTALIVSFMHFILYCGCSDRSHVAAMIRKGSADVWRCQEKVHDTSQSLVFRKKYMTLRGSSQFQLLPSLLSLCYVINIVWIRLTQTKLWYDGWLKMSYCISKERVRLHKKCEMNSIQLNGDFVFIHHHHYYHNSITRLSVEVEVLYHFQLYHNRGS